jgi:hypothetical protein
LVDTLAAAYAENGNFKLAREWTAKVIGLTKTDKDKPTSMLESGFTSRTNRSATRSRSRHGN